MNTAHNKVKKDLENLEQEVKEINKDIENSIRVSKYL